MKKVCKNQQCSRVGLLLSLSEFPRNKHSPDGRYLYCLECCRLKTRALRGVKQVRKYRRQELGIERKPMKMAGSGLALSLVYEAIRSGLRTREAIQRKTRLSYDEVGDALTELIWEARAVRIKNREFLLIGDIHLAA